MKAQYVGQALVVTSSVKVEDIQRAERICPDALILKDEEDQPIFKLGYCDHGIGVGQCGIVFNSKNAEGYAQLTLLRKEKLTKVAFEDEFGLCFIRLHEVEEQFDAFYNEATSALAEAVADVEGVE